MAASSRRSCPASVRRAAAVVAAAVLAMLSGAALAQSGDRERAQMLQMQQQMQRLQSQIAALEQERNQLQDQAKDADRFKKESAQTGKELARSKVEVATTTRTVAALRAQIETVQQRTSDQIETWKKALGDRDEAIQLAAVEKHRLEATITLLTERLKIQTGRADICETKHVEALQLGNELIDRDERARVRLCDPLTAIWKVRDETEVQALRDRLYQLRLDIPALTTK
jgi:septal ring factor EnvC (AmiA/AmiB activator)